MSLLSSTSSGLSPNRFRSVKKTVCRASLFSLPFAMSPDFRIEETSKEHPRWNRNSFHMDGMRHDPLIHA